MATVSHKSLPNGQLHEPKGIGSALAGKVYTSDGAGSGSWTYSPLGWGYYQDNGATQAVSTTAVKLKIDGAGALTTTSYLPREIRGSGNLWDTTNNKITPIRLGDAYSMRLDIPVSAEAGSPVEMTIQLDIGGGATPTVPILTLYAATGKSVPYTITIGIPLLVLSSTVVTNGIQVFAKTNTGTCTVDKPSITLIRLYDGNM